MENQHVMFLRGKRIYLRPVQKDDIPKLYVWMNDYEGVTQFLTSRYPNSIEDEEAWHESMRKNKKTDVVFAIVTHDTHECIGVMGLHRIDHISGTAVTGSFIGDECNRSKGYATEAKMLVLHYAFHILNLRKICSHVFATNSRSMRALEKSGYACEGVLKEHRFLNGSYVDEHLFAVFRTSFEPLWERFVEENLHKT